MLEFLEQQKKEGNINLLKLVSPAKGKIVPLSDVADSIFAKKVLGDGFAIMIEDDIIVAPVDGELTLVFKTKHAFVMTLDNDIELLVHIGLETDTLNGKGFEQLVQARTKVKAGNPIIKVNREFIKSKGISLITPILITNPGNIKFISTVENIDVISGETIILEYTF